MCWSATADLVAGAGIAAIGVACVACVVRRRQARDLGRLPIRDEAINVFMGLPDDGAEPRLELG